MYCRQCGYNNDNYTKACRRCGSSLAVDDSDTVIKREAGDGELKYAAKRESFKEWLMIPFEKLNRARPDNTRKIVFYTVCAAAVFFVLIIAAAGIVRSCSTVEEEDSYGNSGMNILQEAVACTDGEYIYYLVSTGDNTGVFRQPCEGGEILKLSYLKLRSLSIYDGWLYGTDPYGIPYRVPSSGGEAQQLYPSAVCDMQIFNHCVYFITESCELMRAAIDTIDQQGGFSAERIAQRRVSSFLIEDGVLYFIESTESFDNSTAFVSSNNISVSASDISASDSALVSTPEGEPAVASSSDLVPIPEAEALPEPEVREWRILEDRTADPSSWPTTDIRCNYPETVSGPIWRMQPDGSDAEQLTYESCSNLCVYGDYLYYTTEKLTTVSASDVFGEEYGDAQLTRQVLQCWKLDLHTLKYMRFLDKGTVTSHMLPCEDGFYFLGEQGDMMFYSSVDEALTTVLTDVDPVRHCCAVGDWIYFSSYDGLTITRIKRGEKVPEQVCPVSDAD